MTLSKFDLIATVFLNACILQVADFKNPEHWFFVFPNDKVVGQSKAQMIQSTKSQ